MRGERGYNSKLSFSLQFHKLSNDSQPIIDARWRTLGCKALLITPDFHNGAQCAQMAPLNRILPLFQK